MGGRDAAERAHHVPQAPGGWFANSGAGGGGLASPVGPLGGGCQPKGCGLVGQSDGAVYGAVSLVAHGIPAGATAHGAPRVEQASPGQQRLDQRVTALLLAALPDTLKQELVATRQLHTAAILLKVLKTYQPGGQAEKASTLAAVTQTCPATSPSEAVDQLRIWRRQVLRAKELQVVLPDASLQVRALDRIMMQLLAKNGEASFRVSAFRMTYQIDVQPSETTVGYLYDMLMAEAEQLRLAGEQSGKEKEGAPTVMKLGTTQSHGGETWKCRGWGTDSGCRFGAKCKFSHDELPDQKNRCFQCSSIHHRKAECPHGKEELSSATGGSGYGGHGAAGEGKASGGFFREKGDTKGKGKGKKGGKDGGGKKPQKREEESSGKPQVAKAEVEEEIGAGQSAAAITSGTGEQAGELMQEVTSLLKTLRVGPAAKAVSLRSVREGRFDETLLDGGATHCLREGQQRFAKEGLSPWHRDQAHDDAALWLKTLRWMMRVGAKNPQAEVLVEQPRDTEEWRSRTEGQPPHPSSMGLAGDAHGAEAFEVDGGHAGSRSVGAQDGQAHYDPYQHPGGDVPRWATSFRSGRRMARAGRRPGGLQQELGGMGTRAGGGVAASHQEEVPGARRGACARAEAAFNARVRGSGDVAKALRCGACSLQKGLRDLPSGVGERPPEAPVGVPGVILLVGGLGWAIWPGGGSEGEDCQVLPDRGGDDPDGRRRTHGGGPHQAGV